MKANNGKGNCIERDEWETPQWLFNILDKQYKFNIDCCANLKNTKCKIYSDNFEMNIKNPNYKIKINSWMNPPFSKAKKMFKAFFNKNIENKGVAIYRCDNMETKIWQEIIFPNATWILIPKGRINYEGSKGKGSRFPSAIIGYNVKKPKNIEGTILKNA